MYDDNSTKKFTLRVLKIHHKDVVVVERGLDFTRIRVQNVDILKSCCPKR